MTDLPSRMGPDEVRAAVFCGANTAQRLAREWSIPVALAESLIQGSLGSRVTDEERSWLLGPPRGQGMALHRRLVAARLDGLRKTRAKKTGAA